MQPPEFLQELYFVYGMVLFMGGLIIGILIPLIAFNRKEKQHDNHTNP